MIKVPNTSLYLHLLKEARYARDIYRKNFVYLVYGKACMARDLKAITKEEFFDLNDLLIRDCINNPEWFHEAHRREG